MRFTSIVVPVYNQWTYTRQCLESVDAQTPAGDWEVIVVDNGSTDETQDALRSMSLRNGRLRVVRHESNLGFGLACNAGMAIARGDGVVLLNNDAVVLGDWLEGLWSPLLEASTGGMSGPITNFGRRTQVRRLPDGRTEEEMQRIFSDWTRSHAGIWSPTDVLSGFCLLVTRQVMDRIGGFDPCYGLGYFEDDDYSLRARLAGFSLWICEGVLVYHHGAVTSKATGLVADASAHSKRNWIVFREKWQLPPDRLPHQFTVDEVRALWRDHAPLHVPLTSPER